MNQALCYRSYCWFKGVRTWSTGYQGAVWKWHFKNYQALYQYDSEREWRMLALSA